MIRFLPPLPLRTVRDFIFRLTSWTRSRNYTVMRKSEPHRNLKTSWCTPDISALTRAASSRVRTTDVRGSLRVGLR